MGRVTRNNKKHISCGLALALASSIRMLNDTHLPELGMLCCRAVSCAGEVRKDVSAGRAGVGGGPSE